MSSNVARVVVVLVVLGLSLVVAAVARKVQRPVHPHITVGDAGDRPGVVLFTSTECGTCKKTIALLRSQAVAFREITYDLEPQRFDLWMVFAVPLCVVLDTDGAVIEVMSGVPRTRTLRRAIRRAGIVQV